MSTWTDARVDLATTQWRSGASAGEIAAMLGDVTRNAVIGLIHRKGLQRRTGDGSKLGGQKRAAATRTKKQPAQPQPIFVLFPTRFQAFKPGALPAEPVDVYGPGVPLLRTKPNGCRFAVTGNDAPMHLFCDAPRALGHSWCKQHCAVAYRPVEQRKVAA